MALTFSQKHNTVVGNKRMTVTAVTFDSSYPTGGEAVTAADFGLVVLDIVLVQPPSGFFVEFDSANSKLVVRHSTAGHTHTENTAGTYTQNATTAANTSAAGSEVPNAASLATLTCTVLALGS